MPRRYRVVAVYPKSQQEIELGRFWTRRAASWRASLERAQRDSGTGACRIEIRGG